MGERIPENKMGTMPVGKLLADMAIPMMISMLVQALYNVVDSVFVSRISENALNAVSLAFPLQNLMIAFGSGTAVGMNALLSRSLGAKQQEQVDRAANTGIFLFGCTYVLFALIGAFLSRPFFLAQTHDAEIVGYGVDYANLGVETANMVSGILLDGNKPAATPVLTFDNGTATINTDICKELGLNYDDLAKTFAPLCTKVQSIVTAENFDDLNK